MDLSSLKFAKGSKKKPKRVGRGPGSGHGKTSCRGQKGQKSRSGAKSRPWFEGGQMPLQRRIPKRGFTNIFKKKYQVINLNDLKKIQEKSISPKNMFKARLIRKRHGLTKILGMGEISSPLEVHAHAFSKQAIQKIEEAGGKVFQL